MYTKMEDGTTLIARYVTLWTPYHVFFVGDMLTACRENMCKFQILTVFLAGPILTGFSRLPNDEEEKDRLDLVSSTD